jgi:hypothetical protein
LLAEGGFTLDDNIHYEEYWKQKTD